MAISPELEAQILRYYHAEKWRMGTIAHQLHVHHGTVKRVLMSDGVPAAVLARPPSLIDPYLPFILETLKKFSTLTASRLYEMVRERGYRGSPNHFRHLIAMHRPRPMAEAYLRLLTLPGEQGQIDWGHFGHLEIGRARRPLMAFVAVLSYSRQIFLCFFLDAKMENFLRGHVRAFAAWNGLPRILLYDNLKSAVLERSGDAIRFNPTLLAFAGHYRFEPRPVAVARGNEKGRVERAIRYVRDSFFAARSFVDIEDLNAQAMQWCLGQAADRPSPADNRLRVGEVFAQEQAQLLRLPEHPFPTDERVEVTADKTPYVRFDRNDYSIPHTHVRRMLTVQADPQRVRIVDGSVVLADHPRSYDKGKQIEEPFHIDNLVKHKRQARQHRGMNLLNQAAPASADLLMQASRLGNNLGAITVALLSLLERYGAAELQLSIVEALAGGVPHPNAVRVALERRRLAQNKVPPVALILPEHVQRRDKPVRPHRLDTYDKLKGGKDDGQ
jgi:transposase